MIEVESGAVRPLVSQPGPDSGPRWSPDGAWISFTDNALAVHVLDVESGDVRTDVGLAQVCVVSRILSASARVAGGGSGRRRLS